MDKNEIEQTGGMYSPEPSALEKHFEPFRNNIIGIHAGFTSPFGYQQIIYADWIASGRLYGPIEETLLNSIAPYVANTHTETNETGSLMTRAYQLAHKLIKEHVNAGPKDVIITSGFGMTGVVNKFQRILGLRKGCTCGKNSANDENDIPVVFITHMEHHSNHTSWLETDADVVQIMPDANLMVDLEDLQRKLELHQHRKFKIGSFTACSNVTGIHTPVYEMASLMHEYGGLCFIDYAANAPYETINMHPEDPMQKLDAIFFSPHKFLGGPGSSGVLIFDSSMYKNTVPDQPGGGTVDWTNPWGEYKYVDDIEAREDGGTPGFLQAIRTALAIQVKNQMGVEQIKAREDELLKIAFPAMKAIPGVRILANHSEERLGVISFYIENLHYNLLVKLLNDRYGVQVRGGCACAGTYGHFLLDVTYEMSHSITEKINQGDLSLKPGWVRLSLHPTMTNAELLHILKGIQEIALNFESWKLDYIYNKRNNEFAHKDQQDSSICVKNWFTLEL
ncbi:MAG: aminotransferase class V-fold PLP-dependent enzyme [Bacteroidales bacterium]|nr:aminotransferase class V-fold PLP-dependent enzyme [Bacteroidales bacterium]